MATKVRKKAKTNVHKKNVKQSCSSKDTGSYQGHVYDRISKLSKPSRVWPD